MRWLSRHAKVLLAVYSVFLAVAFLSPTSSEQSGAVGWVCRQLWGMGLSRSLITFARMEVLANVVIVAPVAFLGSFVWRSLTWRDWTAYAFVVALGVEAAQGLLLPNRQASFGDVVANTAGALLGAMLVVLLGRLLHRRAASVQGATAHRERPWLISRLKPPRRPAGRDTRIVRRRHRR